MTAHGEWTAHGWSRLIFPVFIRVMRRAERGVIANARRALEERRDLSAIGGHAEMTESRSGSWS